MTNDKINAIVASGFNLAAVETPNLRAMYPNGVRPADAAALPVAVRRGWCESYAARLHAVKPDARSDFLFTAIEVQTAIDTLSA